MREVLPELMRWWRDGRTVGVGTVIATFRSAPRPPGASMLVGPSGEAVGSVSGGCVEGAVYELAQEVVKSAEPRLQRYGVSDDDAFAVGLTCGGILDVYVEKVDQQTFPELGEIAEDVEAGRPVAVATVVEHPDPSWIGRRMVVRPDDGATSGSIGSARARTRRSPTTRWACSRPGTTRRSSTDPTASAAARACGSSCGRSRRRPGCWCSVPSTSPPPSPGWATSSATRSPSATPGRSSRRTRASRPPTRSS